MKPRNFKFRKLRRIAAAKVRTGITLTEADSAALREVRDIRLRLGWATRGRS